MTPRLCPFCQADALQVSGTVHAWEHRTYSFLTCRSCGSEVVDPMAAAPEEYYAYEQPGWRWEYGVTLEAMTEASARRVLDIGCGEGAFLAAAAPKVESHLGVDFNLEKLAIAESRGVTCRRMDIRELDAQDGFDTIVSFHVLEHLEDPDAFARQVANVVRPGGRVFISIPNTERFELRFWRDRNDFPPNHLSRITQQGVEALFRRAGLTPLFREAEPNRVDVRRALGISVAHRLEKLGWSFVRRLPKSLERVVKAPFFVLALPGVLRTLRSVDEEDREGYTALFCFQKDEDVGSAAA